MAIKEPAMSMHGEPDRVPAVQGMTAYCTLSGSSFESRRLPVLPDTVEEVWFEVIAAARIGDCGHAGEQRAA
jgi:hypothetical protein